jgi:hypothetical protein
MKNVKFTDADKARALARFRSLRGPGGVRLSFVAFGPTVRAVDPEVLPRATIGVIIEASEDRSPNLS